MKRLTFLITAIILITANGCGKLGICVRGSGPLVTETRILPSFDKINLYLAANVYYVQGANQSVEIEAQENILKVLETEVSDDDRLIIGFEKNCVNNFDDISIYITTPDLEEMAISGSGKFIGANLIDIDHLDIDIAGSGEVLLDSLNTSALETKISGSGEVFLAGPDVLTYHDIEISGSGQVSSFNLPVEHVDVHISGSGDCRVNALTTLDVNISGSGNVYYIGNPAINISISGSGQLINSN